MKWFDQTRFPKDNTVGTVERVDQDHRQTYLEAETGICPPSARPDNATASLLEPSKTAKVPKG